MSATGTGLVGREAEQAAVGSFLARASEGPAALLLTGEAGIGKTAIWRAGVDLARTRGRDVLVTRPSEAETRLPYAGLVDLLGNVADTELATLPRAQRRAIEIALLRVEPTGGVLDRHTVAVGLLGLLGRVSGRHPVVVAIDDVQWLDEATRVILEFAARRLAAARVGFLVTARASRAKADALGLVEALPNDRVAMIDVLPLPRRETDRLLHLRLDVALADSTLRRVHEQSGGNPLFALEIGRALVRQGVSAASGFGLPVPDSLRELVLERLYHLPGTARDVLLVVAALSRPTVAHVRAALGDDERTMRAIARAEDAGVLELEGDTIRFGHPLLGSVLYGEAQPDVRRRVHRRLAEVVGDLDERARHLALATIGGDEAVAAQLEAASDRARARGAPDAAATLASDARRLTPADRAADDARRTLKAADAFLDAGMSGAARDLLEPLIEALPPGPEQALALHGLGRVRMYESGLLTAIPPLRRAAEVAGDNATLQSAIGRDLGIALSQTGDLHVAREVATRTLDWARRTGHPDLTATVGVHLASVEFLLGLGVRHDLLTSARESDDFREQAFDPSSTEYVPTDLVVGAMLKWSDQFALARSRFGTVRQRLAATGDETLWIPWSLQAGELELWAGNWDDAARIAEEGRVSSERRLPAMQQDHTYVVAAVEAHRGEMGAARAAALASLAQAERTSDRRFLIRAHAVLGFIDLSIGDSEGAVRQLGRAWELFRDASYGDPGVIRFVPELIEALVLRGEHAQAGELHAWLAERGETLNRPYARATGARCRALLAGSDGRVDDALEAAADALRHHNGLPQPFELARTQLVHGTLLRRAKAKREARAALSHALTGFEKLGARLWAERTRGELGRISGRAPTMMGLTPTEARIAQLAAQGYGNREIAETLVVSAKTVEAHLTRIYDKLEVRTRGDLVRRSRSGEFPDFAGDPTV
jgi:DNA-binding CsgD family transcriptional regulator